MIKRIFIWLSKLFKAEIGRIDLLGNEIPSKIHQKFIKLYPNAFNINWYYENDSFVVYFQMEGTVREIHFNTNGKIISEFRNIDADSISPQIVRKLITNSKGEAIINLMEDISGGQFRYKMTFKKHGIMHEYTFDNNGEISFVSIL